MHDRKAFSFVIVACFVSYTVSGQSCTPKSELDDKYMYKKHPTINCGCDNPGLCLRKCCRPGFYLTKGWCVKENTTRPFDVPVYTNGNVSIGTKTVTNYLAGVMNCSFYLLINKDQEHFYIQRNNRLWITPAGNYYDQETFCVDLFVSKNVSELGAFVCFPGEGVGRKINKIGMLISIPFLLITFLVHWILPERNLHMKALMFYVLNLMLSYVFLVTIELSSSLPPTLCSVLGYMCLFFFVSSIFWINVICIDIWLTFSGFLGIQGGKKENKRLIYYSAYAIALPLLLMLIIFLINMFGDETKSYYPDIGGTQCFLKEGLPYLLYFHGPMGLLLCVNIIFFTLTALKIRSVKKETAMLKKGGNRTTTENTEKYYLYLKLLFAMGLNWSLETISWIFENYTTAPKWIWYLTDFCNAVYGLVIFLIFVCKRRTWKVLKKRYYQFTGRPHLAQTMSTSTTQQTRVTSASVSDAPTNGETVRLAAYK